MSSKLYLAVLLLLGPVLQAEEKKSATSDVQILDAIKKSMATYYDSYNGTQSKRIIDVKEIDPDSGDVEKVKKIERTVREYIRKDRESKVDLCVIDGKKADIEDCEDQGAKNPLHPMFGQGSEKYYNLKLVSRIDSTNSLYKVEVIPKEEDDKYFKGFLYFNESYRLKKMQGSLAKLPFPLKAFDFVLNYETYEKIDVVTSGEYAIGLYIPLVLDKTIKTSFQAKEHQLLL